MEVTQSKHTVTAKPIEPQHWSSAHGRIKDHTIPRMPFNTIVLSGEISDDENSIEWSNDVVWTRVEETKDDPESDSEPEAEDATGDVIGDATGDEAAAAAADAGGEADPDNTNEKDGTAAEKTADTGSVPEPDDLDRKDGDAQPAGPPPPAVPEQPDAGNAAAPAPAPDAKGNDEDGSTKTKDSEKPTTGKDSEGDKEVQLTKVNAELKKAKADAQKAKADTERAKADAKDARKDLATSNAKQKSGKKELMACREQTLTLQTAIEEKDQYIAVLYCVIGVLVVLLCFQSCRRMGSAADATDGDAAEEAEWAQERHSQMRSQIAGGNTIAKAL